MIAHMMTRDELHQRPISCMIVADQMAHDRVIHSLEHLQAGTNAWFIVYIHVRGIFHALLPFIQYHPVILLPISLWTTVFVPRLLYLNTCPPKCSLQLTCVDCRFCFCIV